jgi:hypothetical protein
MTMKVMRGVFYNNPDKKILFQFFKSTYLSDSYDRLPKNYPLLPGNRGLLFRKKSIGYGCCLMRF